MSPHKALGPGCPGGKYWYDWWGENTCVAGGAFPGYTLIPPQGALAENIGIPGWVMVFSPGARGKDIAFQAFVHARSASGCPGRKYWNGWWGDNTFVADGAFPECEVQRYCIPSISIPNMSPHKAFEPGCRGGKYWYGWWGDNTFVASGAFPECEVQRYRIPGISIHNMSPHNVFGPGCPGRKYWYGWWGDNTFVAGAAFPGYTVIPAQGALDKNVVVMPGWVIKYLSPYGTFPRLFFSRHTVTHNSPVPKSLSLLMLLPILGSFDSEVGVATGGI
ncbi:hypothetical protein B0H16DRAFT_1467680 [Mycena metata]|uniref:Uncharacterized protein n=1 Tax=Mycena metata TaxID=1033252 RepID=A0AAD7I3I9_9AGAR|nr:hypothetical protein B0H16DRAFT_1467680 [Mycena metata]